MALRLTISERMEDGIEIVAVLACDRVSNRANFVDDGIPNHSSSSPDSSSGVQMAGGRNPASRHTASIFPRTAAFAICVQFQVIKKYTLGFAIWGLPAVSSPYWYHARRSAATEWAVGKVTIPRLVGGPLGRAAFGASRLYFSGRVVKPLDPFSAATRAFPIGNTTATCWTPSRAATPLP